MTGSRDRHAIDPDCAGLFPRDGMEHRPILSDDRGGEWLSRAALRAEVLAQADVLAGSEKRLVFLLGGNGSATLCGLLAAAAAGHAVALIDPDLAPERVSALFDAYRPDIVLSSGGLDRLPASVWGDAEWHRRPGTPTAPATAIRGGNAAHAVHDDLLLLLSTSGTTGSPKFVRLSAAAVVANARQIATVLDIGRDSVAVAHLPLHYSYGLSVATSHLVAGGRIFVMDDAITSPSFWPKVARAEGTHFPGVPFHHTVLARLGFDLIPASINTLTQAGGALDQRTRTLIHTKATARGIAFFVMYGQTEAAPRMTTLAPRDLDTKAGSVGSALPGGRLRILDAVSGTERPAGQTGAVIYEGPNVMLGYAEGRADLAKGDETMGRLDTGDLGWLDESGCLFLAGRSRRFAKVAGLRLSLDEIEALVSDRLRVACLDAGERIIVCHEDGGAVDPKQRFRDLAHQFRIPSNSFALRALPALPLRPSGKVDYARLKELVGV